MILIDGVWVCPKCLERKFKVIKRPHSYTCFIKNHDVAPDGRIRFVYVCGNCNINIADYWDMGRKE